MKKLAILVGIVGLFAGCANNQPSTSSKATEIVKKVVDTCEIDYQKCSAECKINNINEASWKQTACEAKCKTIYGACKTKEKTIEGVNYIKEKISN